MSVKIERVTNFLESLIGNTWTDKIIWEIYDNEYGVRFIVRLPVSQKKFIRVEVFEAGKFTTIETKYFLEEMKSIDFEKIKFADYEAQIVRLKLAIKRQKDAKIAKIMGY
jgi:hypothetical protein